VQVPTSKQFIHLLQQFRNPDVDTGQSDTERWVKRSTLSSTIACVERLSMPYGVEIPCTAYAYNVYNRQETCVRYPPMPTNNYLKGMTMAFPKDPKYVMSLFRTSTSATISKDSMEYHPGWVMAFLGKIVILQIFNSCEHSLSPQTSLHEILRPCSPPSSII
jgi:hypothetical protein